jgi:hypothetical protein
MNIELTFSEKELVAAIFKIFPHSMEVVEQCFINQSRSVDATINHLNYCIMHAKDPTDPPEGELEYYGGDGYDALPEIADYTIKVENEIHFNTLSEAREYYDSLHKGKALWYNMELIDCHTLVK